jgi:hypothetical protein
MQTHQTASDSTQPQTFSTHEVLSKLGIRVWDPHTGLMAYVVIIDLPISYSLQGHLAAPTRTVEVLEPLLTIAWDPPRTGAVPDSSWTWEEYQRHAREI